MAYTRLTVTTGPGSSVTAYVSPIRVAIRDYIMGLGQGWVLYDDAWPSDNTSSQSGLDYTVFQMPAATSGLVADWYLVMATSKAQNYASSINLSYNGAVAFAVVEAWDKSVSTTRKFMRHAPKFNSVTSRAHTNNFANDAAVGSGLSTSVPSANNSPFCNTDWTGLASMGPQAQTYVINSSTELSPSTTYDIYLSVTQRRFMVSVVSGTSVLGAGMAGLLDTKVSPASNDPFPLGLFNFLSPGGYNANGNCAMTRMPLVAAGQSAPYSFSHRIIAESALGITSTPDGYDLYQGGKPYASRWLVENAVATYDKSRAPIWGAIRGEIPDLLTMNVGGVVTPGDTMSYSGATYVYIGTSGLWMNTSV